MEERRAIVEPRLHSTMVQTKPLKAGTCKNRVIDGSFEFQIDNLSYRVVWISTIEDIALRVDGVEIPKSNMMFFCNGIGYSIPDMVTHSENFWNCLDTAVLRVYRVGGLPSGDHQFELTIKNGWTSAILMEMGSKDTMRQRNFIPRKSFTIVAFTQYKREGASWVI